MNIQRHTEGIISGRRNIQVIHHYCYWNDVVLYADGWMDGWMDTQVHSLLSNITHQIDRFLDDLLTLSPMYHTVIST